MDDRRFRRVAGIGRRDVGGELLLYDPRLGSVHVLNPTGAFLWEELAAPQTVAEMVASLRREFEVGAEHDPRVEVARLIEELKERGLVAEERD